MSRATAVLPILGLPGDRRHYPDSRALVALARRMYENGGTLNTRDRAHGDGRAQRHYERLQSSLILHISFDYGYLTYG